MSTGLRLPTPVRNAMCQRAWRPALAGAALVLTALPALAQVYTADDGQGGVLLTNHRPEGDATVLVEAPPSPVAPPKATVPSLPGNSPEVAPTAVAAEARPVAAGQALAPVIRAVAQKHALPEALLTAMVAVESAFDDRAISRKGAKGLMQLMPDTARRFGVKDVFAAEQNLHGGAAYMRVLMDQFANDMALALAAYNAGEGAVLRAGRRIPAYPETQNYVRKVLAHLANSDLPGATRR